LKRKPTVTIALHKYIQRLQQSIDRELEGLSRAVTPDTVHGTRTAARRLRAVLRAFRRELNPAALHRYGAALQDLARDLDAVRDADVAQLTISSRCQKRFGATHEGFDGLKALVAKNRSRAVRDLQSVMDADTWSARFVNLQLVASDPGLIVESQQPMTSIALRVLQHRRRRLRAALRYRGQAPRALHRLRLKIKTLRYLLELCVTAHHGMARAELEQLRELQDCLGDLHDAWCLRRVLKNQSRHRGAAAGLSAKLKARQKELFDKFRKHRRKLLRIWSAAKPTESG